MVGALSLKTHPPIVAESPRNAVGLVMDGLDEFDEFDEFGEEKAG